MGRVRRAGRRRSRRTSGRAPQWARVATTGRARSAPGWNRSCP